MKKKFKFYHLKYNLFPQLVNHNLITFLAVGFIQCLVILNLAPNANRMPEKCRFQFCQLLVRIKILVWEAQGLAPLAISSLNYV